MAPNKKAKSTKAAESLTAKLTLVVKSGKYSCGYKTALRHMRSGKGEIDILPLLVLGLERQS
jgi:large subunit ribosomal protein L30e